MSVTLRLADDIDIARGDLICRPNNAPAVAQNVEALVCWMDETRPLTVGGKYAIKHTTRSARAVVRGLNYRLDINSLHRDEGATELKLNEIGRVKLRTTVPLLADQYRRNRATGGFVVIDETTNRTVGAGMIIEAS
jgi:bifunctional enzyme CysN/CysC